MLGHCTKAIVCWTTGLPQPAFYVLNRDEAPSKERIGAYQAWLNGEAVNPNFGDEQERADRSIWGGTNEK